MKVGKSLKKKANKLYKTVKSKKLFQLTLKVNGLLRFYSHTHIKFETLIIYFQWFDVFVFTRDACFMIVHRWLEIGSMPHTYV